MPVSDKDITAIKAVALIQKQARKFKVPSVTQISLLNNPYRVLISCILSLRTRDKATIEASRRLFRVADDPWDMVKLSSGKIEKAIFPVGFYRNKAKVILGLSRKIINDFQGKVPDRIEDLLSLKGVGRKTANLVLGLGFGIPAICVDTHVHRISNRLGWVKTNKPEETEMALRSIFPERFWIGLNTTLVAFGQNLCLPVSPLCSICDAVCLCKRLGVEKSR